MELHQLRYFCAVARAGNFTRAAEDQHVAQLSLSQQIRKLEDELGAKLFDRFPRFAWLTDFGKAFLPKAGEILRQVDQARTEIQEAEVGTVIASAIPTTAPYFLGPALARFARRYPAVSISVVEKITLILLDRVHNGHVDIVVLALPVRGEELTSEELFHEPLFAALPENHRLAGRRSLALGEPRGSVSLAQGRSLLPGECAFSLPQIAREPKRCLRERPILDHCFDDSDGHGRFGRARHGSRAASGMQIRAHQRRMRRPHRRFSAIEASLHDPSAMRPDRACAVMPRLARLSWIDPDPEIFEPSWNRAEPPSLAGLAKKR